MPVVGSVALVVDKDARYFQRQLGGAVKRDQVQQHVKRGGRTAARPDFSVGISSDVNTAEAIWPTDLTYGTTYRAIIRFNQDTGTATLWIDASLSSDPSIVGSDDGAFSITSFD